MESNALQFWSWGFRLYVPPAPFPKQDQPARFIMVDDINNLLYDIDYETPLLGNSTPWTEVALHTVSDPAVVFPPEQQDMLHKMRFATGILVSIESHTTDIIIATYLGRVNVKPAPQEFVNWSALKANKGKELVAEMRAGLLRNLWSRDPGNASEPISYVTPSRVLNGMPRPWHQDGEVLNDELDRFFVGGRTITPPSRWRVSGLGAEQIEKSKTRAALFVES